MPETPDLASAVADLDDGYLQAQLLLAVRRAGSQEPRRAGLWHALAGLLAAEQQSRRQSAGLTGEGDEGDRRQAVQAALDDVREELRRDAEAIEGEYGDAVGEFPSPAGQAPPVVPDDVPAEPGAAPG